MNVIKATFLMIVVPFLLCSCETLNVASFDVPSNIALEEDESRLWLRSKEEEERIGTGNFLYNDPVLTEYVNSVLQKVIPDEVRDSGLLFEAKVIKDPRLNAFCYPNGVIYIHTGILARMDNEAQLATLLGHEITHAIKRHTLKQFRGLKNKSAFMNTFYVTTAGLGGSYGEIVGTLGQLGAIGAFYGYSRELEREADSYGFEEMLAAGYDINEAPRIFEHLKEDFDKEKKADPFFFSSHPRLNERIESYKELIKSVYAQEAQDSSKIRNEEEFIALTGELLLVNADMDIALGRFETAKVTIQKYISHFPGNAQGYYYMGKIYEEKFKQPENKRLKEKLTKGEIKEEAIKYYQLSLTKDSEFALSHRNLGMLYFKDNNKTEAKKYLASYLALCSRQEDKAYAESYLRACENE